MVRAPSHSSSIGDDHLETFIGSPTTTGGETFGEWMVVSRMVIKIPIRILKSYDFTIQHYENDSNLN